MPFLKLLCWNQKLLNILHWLQNNVQRQLMLNHLNKHENLKQLRLYLLLLSHIPVTQNLDRMHADYNHWQTNAAQSYLGPTASPEPDLS